MIVVVVDPFIHPTEVRIEGSTINNKPTFSTTQTFAHTHPARIDDAILVRVGSSTNPTGITYGGQALTLIALNGFGFGGTAHYIGVAKPTGSNNVVITYAGAISDAVARVDSLSHVDQTTPSDANNSAGGTGTGSTLAVTIADRGFAFDSVGTDNGSITDTGGQTQQFNQADGFLFAAGGYYVNQSAGSKSFSWTWPFTAAGHVVCSIKNAP